MFIGAVAGLVGGFVGIQAAALAGGNTIGAAIMGSLGGAFAGGLAGGVTGGISGYLGGGKISVDSLAWSYTKFGFKLLTSKTALVGYATTTAIKLGLSEACGSGKIFSYSAAGCVEDPGKFWTEWTEGF